jgi:ABC-type phosphate transport system substrate-binding protein
VRCPGSREGGTFLRRALKPVLLLTMVIAAVALSAAPAGAQGITRPQTFLHSGSDTSYKLMSSIDSAYGQSEGCETIVDPGETQPLDFRCLPNDPDTITTENFAHDRIAAAHPLGSSNGINQLCQQGLAGVAQIHFARSSRAPRDTDCDGMNFVAFARDALPFEAFPDLPGSPVADFDNPDPLCAGEGLCLTQSQLTGIFVTCTITNWAQVGGDSAPIAIYTAQAGSGTRSTWDGFVGGDSSLCTDENHVIFENDNTPILDNPDAARAIFYYGFGDWQIEVEPNPDGSALGAVDGVAPSEETIADGSFPFSRFMYNVYCVNCAHGRQASARLLRYIEERTGWICKQNQFHSDNPLTGDNYGSEIEDIISAHGFVNIPVGPIGGGEQGESKCRLFTT